MLLKLEQIAEMLSKLPETASVSITSVDNLATELFTHRGAGTLVRQGESVLVEDEIDPALVPVLTELLEHSFKRKLKPNYFEEIDLECLLRSESNGAIAIVLKGVDGLPYLDKFAVTPRAQGAGLGSSVWQTLIHRYPKLYWRSRSGNPLTRWYYEQADTHISSEHWVAFTRGLTDMQEIAACRDDCLARTESWLPRHAKSTEAG
jgi:acetylglutamate kinase